MGAAARTQASRQASLDQTQEYRSAQGDYSELFPGLVVLDAFCHNKNVNNF